VRKNLGRVWLWAGKIRTIELNLGSPAWRVQTDLHDLLADLHCWEGSDMPLVEQAATLHYRAVHIHPFENGNGRWARMLANIWLKLHGGAMTIWPEQGITGGTSSVRDEYITALRQADQLGMNHLIELHSRYAETPT
jgi:fido (protein-threonine AMPylation protein)